MLMELTLSTLPGRTSQTKFTEKRLGSYSEWKPSTKGIDQGEEGWRLNVEEQYPAHLFSAFSLFSYICVPIMTI